ncbi:MAG: NB-ARC domain-containing protein, partial [Thermoplasmata archaeon]
RSQYYKKKYLLQIRERILLFLDNHVGMYDRAELPLSLTQSGIAGTLEIRRSQVSQVISGLVSDGLVYAELRHIRGGKRRRTCYFLTPEGMDYARRMEARVGSEPIALCNLSGATETVRLEEIPGVLGDGSTLLDVITHVRKSLFDIASYQRKVRQKRKLVAFTSMLPKLHRFVGRQKELEEVRDFLDSEEQNIMAIKGIAGIGKSVLAARILKEKKGKTNLFYYQFKDWTTLRSVLLSLSKLFSELERNDLRFYLESNKEIGLGEVGLILEECLRGLDGILVFDDCQFARGDALDFLECSKNFLGVSNGFKMIVLGRRIPPFYSRHDVAVRGRVKEMELGGLSHKDSREMLSTRELPKSMFSEIIKNTKGHPLFLELVDSSTRIVAGNIEKFLKQEIYSRMNEKEKMIMSIASVFRSPVSASAFFADEMLNQDAIDSLISQSLLSENAQSKYTVHDTVKMFFYERLPDSKRILYHKNAGDYYSNFSDSDSVLEAQYHFVKGRLHERAAELATSYGDSLIREGFSEDLLEILEELKDPETWGPFLLEVYLVRGRILSLLGRLEDAIEDFKRAEKSSVHEGDLNSLLEAISRIGEIRRMQGKNEEALEILQKAKERVTERTDISVVTRIYGNLALTYGLQANFDRAYNVLNLLDDYTSAHPHRPERAEYLMARGKVLGFQGLHEQAYEVKKEAVEICEGNDDVLGLAEAYSGLGASLYHLEKNDMAFEYFDRAIKFAQRIGDLRTQGYLLFNTASIYIEKPNLHKAQAYLDDAKEIFDRLEEKRTKAMVDLSLAFVYYKKEEPHKAGEFLRVHLEQIEKHGTPSDLMASYKTAAELYKEMGHTDQARKCFELALSFSEKLERPKTSLESFRELMEESKLS